MVTELPVPTHNSKSGIQNGSSVGHSEEIAKLRRQLDHIVRENGAEPGGTSVLAYVNLGLAVLGVLLGLTALLRH